MQIMPTTPMPLRRDFHITPHNGIWKLSREYTTDLMDTYFSTQAEAIGIGITQAREGLVSLVIHGRDGRINRVWSYDDARVPD